MTSFFSRSFKKNNSRLTVQEIFVGWLSFRQVKEMARKNEAWEFILHNKAFIKDSRLGVVGRDP